MMKVEDIMADFDVHDLDWITPEEYLHFHKDRLDERAPGDADHIEAALDLSTGDRVLDLTCGYGRVTNRLAARGYDAAGIEIAPSLVELGREEAAELGVDTELVEGDARDLPWDDDSFDAAYIITGSIAILPREMAREILAEAARVLRPGGRLLVDAPDRDAVMQQYQEVTVDEVEGDYLVDRHEFDPRAGRLAVDRLVVRDGQAREESFSLWLYSYTELAALLADTGFEVVDEYGNLRGDDYSLDTKRLCLVAEPTGEE